MNIKKHIAFEINEIEPSAYDFEDKIREKI